jgi:hypothetical protein
MSATINTYENTEVMCIVHRYTEFLTYTDSGSHKIEPRGGYVSFTLFKIAASTRVADFWKILMLIKVRYRIIIQAFGKF